MSTYSDVAIAALKKIGKYVLIALAIIGGLLVAYSKLRGN